MNFPQSANSSPIGKGEIVNDKSMQTNEFGVKQQCLFAKFGDGRWYAIPPGMEAGLRKAGAEVCVMPVSDAVEEATN